jgi:hypothetical protein
MACRRVLANVAHGITDSFLSRNNDVNGYWGLGQLLSRALATNIPSLVIDLRSGLSAPALSEAPLSSLPVRWSDRFWSRVDREGLAHATVHRAALSLVCELAGASARGQRMEYLVRCCTTIADDHGRIYEATRDVRCSPHDPAFELRSARGA